MPADAASRITARPLARPGLSRRLRSASSALVALAVLAGAIVLAAVVNLQANEALLLASRSIEVRERAERFLGHIRDAETGQRGFMLSRDERYLGPYLHGRSAALPEAEAIAPLVKDRPDQLARLARVQELAERKLHELDETLRLARAGAPGEALRHLREGAGEVLMSRLRAEVAAFQASENQLLEQRSGGLERRRLGASLGLVVALAALSFVIWQQLRLRQRRAFSLSHLNAELESKVAERTRQLENERLRIEALLRDVNHRVGNNLAMVSALLSVQGRQTREPAVRMALDQAQARIQAIAAGQRRLRLDIETDEIDGRPYMEDLLAEIGKAVEGRPIRIVLEMEPLRLPGRDAVSFVVIVNELVTNAIKHAFPEGMEGTITVRLVPAGGEDGGIVLSVSDDGIGLGDDREPAAGLGQTVLASLLRSMRATQVIAPLVPGSTRPGTLVTIQFPKRD